MDRRQAKRLVNTYSDLILRLSYTYLKSTADAQDICQTVFLKLLTADAPLEPGTATVHLADLKQGIGEDAVMLAEVSWELRFDFAFEDSSLELPGGQSFTANGETAVPNSISISPLSLRIDYTVDTALQPENNSTALTPSRFI